MPLSIGQILTASFPAAKREILQGRPFASHLLSDRATAGLITFAALGDHVEVPYEQPDGSFGSNRYDVQQISIPMAWTQTDELRPEADKINMAARMIENAINTVDDQMERMISGGRAIVSRHYCYSLGEVHQEQHSAVHYCQLYTALAVITARRNYYNDLEAAGWPGLPPRSAITYQDENQVIFEGGMGIIRNQETFWRNREPDPQPWTETNVLRELERSGAIQRVNFPTAPDFSQVDPDFTRKLFGDPE